MVQLLVSEVLQCEEKTQKKILNEFMRIYYSLSFSPFLIFSRKGTTWSPSWFSGSHAKLCNQ